ncbi:isochorismate synthase DhbC [Paenibacillus tarimensis]
MLDLFENESSCFFASPTGALITKGIRTKVSCEGKIDHWEELPARVSRILQEAKNVANENPIVLGALPFDRYHPIHLFVPNEIVRSAIVPSSSDMKRQQHQSAAYTITPVPSAQQFIACVDSALKLLHDSRLTKVVLSRTLQLRTKYTINVKEMIANLARRNSDGYTFAITIPQPEAGARTLIGASPELLVSRFGNQITVNPLAGSIARSDDPAEDKRRADELFSSYKNRREHAIVIDAVKQALHPLCQQLHVPPAPELIKTSTMWHLSTVMKGVLADANTTSLELAVALHPTPAVCGTPTDKALEAIRDIEPFDRAYYTGMVGWCDSAGDGEWVVTIRCADIQDQLVQLYAGAGIVAESKPMEELAETSAKFQTMLAAMGLVECEAL